MYTMTIDDMTRVVPPLVHLTMQIFPYENISQVQMFLLTCYLLLTFYCSSSSEQSSLTIFISYPQNIMWFNTSCFIVGLAEQSIGLSIYK
jgi:hypothetical protein